VPFRESVRILLLSNQEVRIAELNRRRRLEEIRHMLHKSCWNSTSEPGEGVYDRQGLRWSG
jgi:hypothetical protein